MGNSNLWRSDCSNQQSLRATIWITNPELAWWYHACEVSYIAELWTRAPKDNRTIPGGDELGGGFLQTIVLGFCGEVWETRYHLSGTSGGCAFHILDMVSSVIITLQVSTHYASVDVPSKFSFSQRTVRIPFEHCLSTSQRSQFNNNVNRPTHTQPSNTLPFILSYPRINHTYRRPSLHQHTHSLPLSVLIEPS